MSNFYDSDFLKSNRTTVNFKELLSVDGLEILSISEVLYIVIGSILFAAAFTLLIGSWSWMIFFGLLYNIFRIGVYVTSYCKTSLMSL